MMIHPLFCRFMSFTHLCLKSEYEDVDAQGNSDPFYFERLIQMLNRILGQILDQIADLVLSKALFSKCRGLKDVEYDITVCHEGHEDISAIHSKSEKVCGTAFSVKKKNCGKSA